MNIDEFREQLVELLNERFEEVSFSSQYVDKLNHRSYRVLFSVRDRIHAHKV